MSKHEPVGSAEECSSLVLEDAGGRPVEAADKVSEEDGGAEEGNASAPRPNTYREQDWEEGPARIAPSSEEPEPRRRFQLEGASSEEIEQAEAQMLAELTCEAYDHAKDCFESARGIDDRVGARARKLAMGCRLATLTVQLVAASDQHRKAMKGG